MHGDTTALEGLLLFDAIRRSNGRKRLMEDTVRKILTANELETVPVNDDRRLRFSGHAARRAENVERSGFREPYLASILLRFVDRLAADHSTQHLGCDQFLGRGRCRVVI